MFGSRSSKLSKSLAYPERLRLPVSGPERQADYRLTGVLVHAGASVNMGHYYSYVRAPNGLWCAWPVVVVFFPGGMPCTPLFWRSLYVYRDYSVVVGRPPCMPLFWRSLYRRRRIV